MNVNTQAVKPEYRIVAGSDYDGYSKFREAIEALMDDGWVLIGGAQPYIDNDVLEFSQTLARNFHYAEPA